MIKLKQAVVVEGKYDKITLENLLDTVIIATNGFGIFKDKEKQAFLRTIAQKSGVIIMTDSDSAGQFLRTKLKGILQTDNIINVYVPQIKGKEKRKKAPSKEGFLGVEGLSVEILQKALQKAGVVSETAVIKTVGLTKADLYEAGLTGKADSSARRKQILQQNGFPQNLSCNALLDILNHCYTKEQALEIIGI